MLHFLKRRRHKVLTREEYKRRVKFTDDFFFARLMQNEQLCLRLAETLLKVKIKSIKLHQAQRTLKRERHTHGIRLDAYLEDENHVIVIEMQTANQRWLFKRIRLYQGLLDTASLPAGSSYMSLKDTYIVFLCTFDPVGLGLPVYTVEQVFAGTGGAKYDDGTCRILYNSLKWEECKDGEIQAVLKYMQTGLADSALMQDIDSTIEGERELQAMRSEYMTYDMKLCEVRDETREETWNEAWDQAWQEGSREKAIATAKRALMRGFAPDVVSDLTGLTQQEVAELL